MGIDFNIFIHFPIIKNKIYLRYYLRKLQRIKIEVPNQKLFDFISLGKNLLDFFFLGTGIIYTDQLKSEIFDLLAILKKSPPEYILEIGTAGGGSLFLLSKIAADNAKIISVDLPYGIHGGGYSKWKIQIYKSMIKNNQRLFLIRKDSHNETTLNEVKNILNEHKIDFLFIDGDHTYKGVKKDFEFYSPLVRKGGIIAFHDIVDHPPEFRCEVDKFWNEIKKGYNHKEIIGNKDQQKAGIGLLFK